MRTSIVLLLLTLGYSTIAQDPGYEIFKVENGLPSNELYDIHIDEHNIVWGTTDRGVFTYDGFEVRSYSTQDGLSFNTNFQIIDDKQGKLWFTGFDGSLSYFEDGKFHQSINNSELRKGVNNSYYPDIAYDSLGNLYTHQIRLFNINHELNYSRLNQDGSTSKMPMDFDTLAYAAKGDFHVLQKKFVNKSFYLIPEEKIYSDNIATFGDNIHFLSFREAKALMTTKRSNSVFEGKSKIYKIENGKAKVVYTSDYSVEFLFIDHKNNLLAATKNGLLIFKNCDFSKPPQRYLDGYFITKLNQDKEGNYWLSTHKNGMISVPSFDIKTIDLEDGPSAILKLLPYKNRLFYTSAYYGVSYLDANLNSHLVKNGITNKNQYNLDILNDTLIVNPNHLLLENSEPELKFINLPLHRGRFSTSIGNEFFVTTRINGYQIIKHNEIVFESPRSGSEIIKNVISLGVDSEKVWMGTHNGLYYFKKENFTSYTKHPHKLFDIRINDIITDNSDRIWFGTIGNGLLCYHDNEVIQISEKDGLISNLVNCVFVESDSLIWVGTNKGLSKIFLDSDTHKPSVNTITNISDKDGIPSLFITDITLWEDYIWTATTNGLYAIPTEFSLPVEQAPNTIIHELKIDGEEMNFNDGAVLKYDQNNGSIFFNAVSYRKPEKNYFRYKLELNNQASSYTTTDDRSIRLTNLKPGNYKFTVQARNKFNTWSEPSTITFTITPHFTKTWWFLGLLLLFSVLLLYFLYTRRVQYLQEKQKHHNRLNEAILKTEIAELSTFRNHFNPHFIFNSLNSIQHYIFDKNIEEANYFLSKFSKLIRSSLRLSEQRFITVAEELKFIDEYLALEFLRFPEKFEYQITVDNNLDTKMLLIPSLITQPIIENVIKHAFKDMDDGKLKISLYDYNEHNISIEIQDNGVGIQTENESNRLDKRNSYGIKIIKDRISLLNLEYPIQVSTMTIKNKPNGKGTIAQFILPKINDI